MKTYRITAIAVLAAIAASAGVARAQICTKNFVDETLPWDNGLAWAEGTVPGLGDVACIPSGKTCLIYNHAVVKAIVVNSDVTNGTGKLEVGRSWSLTISDDSTVDGVLEVYGDAGIKLDGDVTISGSGTVTGQQFHTTDPPIDSTSGNSYTLTIGNGVTLDGQWDIKTALVNNGTVAATTGTIKVSGGGDGSGVWAAETATGTLLITGAEVIGSGHWQLIDNSAATIQFDTSCDCLQGAVTITKGLFDVNENFRTSGKLTMNSGGKVDVAASRSAKFSVSLGFQCLPGGGSQ